MKLSDIGERYSVINEFPDYYITESGKVFSIRLRGKETEPKLRELRPKNPGRDDKYLNIILCRDDGQFTKSIHRLVAEHFVDGYFEGAVVNHIDGNNRNNHYTNLEWCTQKHNIHKSYDTSSVDQVRNYLMWELYSPADEMIGVFKGHCDMSRYIAENKLDTSAQSLAKYGKSRGYYTHKRRIIMPEAVTTIS